MALLRGPPPATSIDLFYADKEAHECRDDVRRDTHPDPTDADTERASFTAALRIVRKLTSAASERMSHLARTPRSRGRGTAGI